MKKQYFINPNIIDPHNSINETGGLIISEEGKIEAVGKKVNPNNLPSREKPFDLGDVDISRMQPFQGNKKYLFEFLIRNQSFLAFDTLIRILQTQIKERYFLPSHVL